MNKTEFLRIHWNYYLMLEEDFRRIIKFVELDSLNFKTFSIEFSKQLQSICSEIDVICKSICKYYDKNSKEDTIKKYAHIILQKLPEILNSEVLIIGISTVSLTPFKEWELEPYQSPQWWSSYNKVKHDRYNNFSQANLENVINALAALFILELNLLKLICTRDSDLHDIPHKDSELFQLKGWETVTIRGLTCRIVDFK